MDMLFERRLSMRFARYQRKLHDNRNQRIPGVHLGSRSFPHAASEPVRLILCKTRGNQSTIAADRLAEHTIWYLNESLPFKMKRNILFVVAMLLAANSIAQSTPSLETRLVGKWAQVGHSGATLQVMVFNADHSYAMYPKCGREAEEWKKAGLSFLPAKWSIIDGNTLRMEMEHAGKTAKIDAAIDIVGQEARVTDLKGNTNIMIPYVGPLPPSCSKKQ